MQLTKIDHKNDKQERFVVETYEVGTLCKEYIGEKKN